MPKKKQTKPVVAVIFRRWPREGNAIIALFPEIPVDHNGLLCHGYMHTGRHSAADYQKCVDSSKPAKKSEYAALFKELKDRGYNMVVRKHTSHLIDHRRHAECVRILDEAKSNASK